VRAFICGLSLLVSLAGLVGCGPGGAPVKGKVYLDGKPLQGHKEGVVIFHPDKSKGNNSPFLARGPISPEGEYELVSDHDANKNIPLGWYQVTVIATVPLKPKDPYSVPKSIIPEFYREPERGLINIEVISKPSPDAYDIKLVGMK
jgi:hypothetical protein